MTLDEAIKLYKDLERINREEYKIFDRDGLNPKSALITAKRYEQLVKWLKDYKRLLGAIEEIKKEIDRDDHADEYCDGFYDGMRNVLAIIDKNKAESEE